MTGLVVELSAEIVIAIRDALIANDVNEAYHLLYQAVDPTFCRYEPWADTEASLPAPQTRAMGNDILDTRSELGEAS